MSILLGPANADHYRLKVGRYQDRWYVDPLPADDIAPAAPQQSWPSVSSIKKSASGTDWTFVGLKRVAQELEHNPDALAGLNFDDRYDRLKQINKSGLRQAAQRGTDVHIMCEQKLRGAIIDPRFLNAEARTYQAAIDSFFDKYQPELFAAEVVCINRGMNGMGYGGTGDAIIRVDGKLYKVDWKSRGEESDHGAYPDEAGQLGGYVGADYIITQGPDGPQRALMPPLDGGLIVSLKPDGYRAYPIDLGKAWEQWESMHARWVARQSERESIGHPWAPGGGPVDLFALIANMDGADRETYKALYRAHEAHWTPEHTAAVKARLAGAQTPTPAPVG